MSKKTKTNITVNSLEVAIDACDYFIDDVCQKDEFLGKYWLLMHNLQELF